MGFQTTGAASEFFAVPASKVLKLTSGISLDQGAMVEPVAVAVHALGRSEGVAGKKVLVLGAGPIGNLVAQAALGSGAAEVLITDLSDFRLGIARQCGIEHGINPTKTDLAAEVARVFGRDKADLILECVGVQATMAQAVSVARKGTDIIVVGVFGEKPTVDLGTVQDRELRLVGTLMYREPDWRRAIELIGKGKIALAPLITDHFPFAEYKKAYEHIEAHRDRAVKVMIVVEE
jgi:L-iditol 2-dehydrogenase